MILPLEELTVEDEAQTACIFGPSGVGKTTLVMTGIKTIIADSNKGTTSVSGQGGTLQKYSRRVKIKRMKDLLVLYKRMIGSDKAARWDKMFHAVSFDHWDDIQHIIMDEIGRVIREKNPDADIDKWEMQWYGILNNRLARYMRMFKNVNVHKFLVCGERPEFETAIMKPSLIGQAKDKMPYACDHLMYMRFGKKNTRWLHLESGERNGVQWFAKTRAWWLGPEWRNVQVQQGDTTFMSRFMDAVKAGPQAKTSTGKVSTKQVVPAGRTKRISA